MTSTELFNEIEQRELTEAFVSAIVSDIYDQGEFATEEKVAFTTLMTAALQPNATAAQIMGVLEFFLGVESFESYMEEFLNGYVVRD